MKILRNIENFHLNKYFFLQNRTKAYLRKIIKKLICIRNRVIIQVNIRDKNFRKKYKNPFFCLFIFIENFWLVRFQKEKSIYF